jgi:hypothetical protein
MDAPEAWAETEGRSMNEDELEALLESVAAATVADGKGLRLRQLDRLEAILSRSGDATTIALVQKARKELLPGGNIDS